MKFIRLLLLLLIEAVLMIVALNAMLANWARFSFGADPVFHRFYIPAPGTISSRALWLGVFCLPPLVWLLQFLAWKRKPAAIQVRTAEGETMLVHPGALIKLVRHQIGQHQAVSSFRVGVGQSGSKGISVKGRISVKHLESLPTIKRELEAGIREGFRQLMGIDKIDKIQLVLDFDQKSLDDADSAYTPRPAMAKPEPPVRGSLASMDEDLDLSPSPPAAAPSSPVNKPAGEMMFDGLDDDGSNETEIR